MLVARDFIVIAGVAKEQPIGNEECHCECSEQSHILLSLKGRALNEKGGRPFNPLYLARGVRVK